MFQIPIGKSIGKVAPDKILILTSVLIFFLEMTMLMLVTENKRVSYFGKRVRFKVDGHNEAKWTVCPKV